jgi:agmatinase
MAIGVPFSKDKLFMGSHWTKTVEKNRSHLVGFGFDGTACFRKGARLGPDAIREASYGIETYSPYLLLDLEDQNPLLDLGNVSVGMSPDQQKNWEKGNHEFLKMLGPLHLKNDNIKLLTLGGEHSISYAPIKKYLADYPDLVVLHLDAHADLRDGYEGYHYSHASIIRRVLDCFGEEHRLIQYGIRSGTKEEFEWMNKNETLFKSRVDFLEFVRDLPAQTPLYLTLDLDYFDPSFFPGTGTPEPGGEDFHSFIKLVKTLQGKNFVGADVVELAPNVDSSGNSSVFAAKVVRELALLLGQKKNDSI